MEGFPTKQRLRNELRNSILVTGHLGLRGLPDENELLAITLMMALNQNLAPAKNSPSLKFQSINIVLISHVISHVTILPKIVNY